MLSEMLFLHRLATPKVEEGPKSDIIGKVAILKTVLSASRKDQSTPRPKDVLDELYEAHAGQIWQILPLSVVEIDFDVTVVARQTDVEPDEQIRWNLGQIDDYARRLAKSARIKWTPVIKPSTI